MTATVHDPLTPVTAGRAGARLLSVCGATLAALAVWTVSVPLLGTDLLVRPGSGSPQTVGAALVVTVSLIAAFLGWALLALLERRTSRPRKVWTRVAVAVLLLSLSGPLSAGTTTSVKVTLALMHLAVGAVLIPALRHSPPTG